MQFTAKQVAEMTGGIIEGNPDALFARPAGIEDATENSICFLHNEKYYPHLYTTKAAVVLVGNDFVAKQPFTTTLVRVQSVETAVLQLLNAYEALAKPKKAAIVHANAIIEEGVTVGENFSLGAFSYITAGSTIGDNCEFDTQVFVGANVKIGNNVKLYAGVKIYYGCVIGDNCVIHANTVIGSDGFGFALDETTHIYSKIPQIGNVIVGNDVEIGANCTLDRAKMGSTKVGNGVKLDNLVQIAHNVEVGDNTVMAAQSGIAGSSKVGRNCRIGGQVGIVGHIKVADFTNIQAQSGVARTIKKTHTSIAGTPAFDYVVEQRAMAIVRSLPDFVKQIRDMENRLRGLEGNV